VTVKRSDSRVICVIAPEERAQPSRPRADQLKSCVICVMASWETNPGEQPARRTFRNRASCSSLRHSKRTQANKPRANHQSRILRHLRHLRHGKRTQANTPRIEHQFSCVRFVIAQNSTQVSDLAASATVGLNLPLGAVRTNSVFCCKRDRRSPPFPRCRPHELRHPPKLPTLEGGLSGRPGTKAAVGRQDQRSARHKNGRPGVTASSDAGSQARLPRERDPPRPATGGLSLHFASRECEAPAEPAFRVQGGRSSR
jgi:hypothetical protein